MNANRNILFIKEDTISVFIGFVGGLLIVNNLLESPNTVLLIAFVTLFLGVLSLVARLKKNNTYVDFLTYLFVSMSITMLLWLIFLA